MKLLKYLVPFLMIGFTTSNVYAQDVRGAQQRDSRPGQDTSFGRELNTREDQPLREFVESKENIDVKDKSKNLEISGDVRFEWRRIQEKGIVIFFDPNCNNMSNAGDANNENGGNSNNDRFCEEYRNLRGGNNVDTLGFPVSVNDFDVEFNLKIKYSFKNAWAKAHLQFDNPAGVRGRNVCFSKFPLFSRDGNLAYKRNKDGDFVLRTIQRDSRWAPKGSGEGMFINLKRAFIGYNMYADGRNRFDIEVGRQKLDDIFDSEIQFTSRFDGVLLRFASAVEDKFDWYLTGGAFVIDERVNHFGYVAEVGVLDLYDTGLDIRYNIIDWRKRGKNRCFIQNPLASEYLNSEITLTYTFSQTVCCKEIPIELYGGFLVNHAARKTVFTQCKKKNLGWYAGIFIGSTDKKGDWSFDIEYIGVQAQAVPEYDVGSLGRGNVLDESLFDILDERFPGLSPEALTVPTSCIVGYFPRRGNTNFVGWRFEFLYAITDNLSLDLVYEFSREEDRRIGGPHRYRDFEIEAIYAF